MSHAVGGVLVLVFGSVSLLANLIFLARHPNGFSAAGAMLSAVPIALGIVIVAGLA